MKEEFELLVEHEIKYTNKEPVPVKDVVEALLALERISSKFLPKTMNALLDTEIKRAEILVEGIEHGSLVEKVVVRLLFGDAKKMNQFLDKVRDGNLSDAWQGLPGSKRVRISIVGVTLAVLVASGAYYVLSKNETPVTQNTVIIIGAEAYNTHPDQLVQIVNAAVGSDRKRLAQDSANFIAPAKNDPNGAIEIDGNQQLTIPAETVRAMPRQVVQEEYESNIEYKDVDLEIRASDRDSGARGWAGVVRDLFSRRIKLVLSDDVAAHDLANRFHVRADIVVTSKPDASGQLRPSQIYVERIIPDNE